MWLIEVFVPVWFGEYEIVVRAIDVDGFEGCWSMFELVWVIGVRLLEGGYVLGGDIFIGKG